MSGITGVFEGGGIKGLALAGAAAAALDGGHQFRRAVGTSAGALVGSLLIAGYDSSELRRMVSDVRWPDLLDAGLLTGIPGIGKHLAMLLHRGFYKGDALEETWRELLAARGVHTFADLPPGSLQMVTTDLAHGRGVILPDDLSAYGIDPLRFPVARAVRMSASVPFLFEPVTIRNRTNGERVLMADGAMAAKFPVQLVERRPDVIGFRLTSPPDCHIHTRVRGPVSLAAAVISAGIGARESLPVLCGRLHRVIVVSLDHDSLDFDITPAEARSLFDLGYEQAKEQFGTVAAEG